MSAGGFRGGTDILKALAIAARGRHRPSLHLGLSSFGQEGVERVLEILRAELSLSMRQCGIPSTARISRASLRHNGEKL
jgi:isopentenyl diphosphate isomerase/L-lactate dehydrogenase-like FMN-dependent dehydrogenase